MREFKLIGHRGASAHEPENTLRSIRRAIVDGADMVEIDVRFAAGEIIVIHDSTVNRTTGGRGSIYQKSFSELRALDAGRGERIPTLAEVIGITCGTIPLNIEIKDVSAIAPVCEMLEDFREQGWENFVISSFHSEAVIEVRKRLAGIPIGILAPNRRGAHRTMFALAEQLQAVSVHPHIHAVTRALVQTAHAKNLLVLPYTARKPEQLLMLLDYQADGCFADDPDWARRLVASMPVGGSVTDATPSPSPGARPGSPSAARL